METLAARHLGRQGMKLLERSFHCRSGELDLIMLDRSAQFGAQLVFVEVRYRASNAYGGAAASVSVTKQQRLIRAAQYYRRCRPGFAAYSARFDVVAISGPLQEPRIQWLRNAFECI